jgi:hypothetical protein
MKRSCSRDTASKEKFDPSNFLPLWHQVPKREEKIEESLIIITGMLS